MGLEFLAVNLSKKEFFELNAFGDSPKAAIGFTDLSNGIPVHCLAVTYLCSGKNHSQRGKYLGHWQGDQVDYPCDEGPDGSDMEYSSLDIPESTNLYCWVLGKYKNITSELVQELDDEYGVLGYINSVKTKRETRDDWLKFHTISKPG